MKNWLLPSVIVTLSLISVAVLKSVAPQLATQQLIFFLLGVVVFFVTVRVPFQQLLALTWPAYIGLCLLLVASLIAGQIMGKTGRWIPIFGLFNLQPSQLAIPIVAMLLAKINQKLSLNTWSNLGKILAIIGLPGVLILIEPDLGTTLVYLASTGMVVFTSDISWKKIGLLIGGAAVAAIFAWFFVLHPYQKQRITSFIDSSQDTSGASYNARQALIAAGSGQLTGRGLGQGVQSHLRFLPERQTDFIFASLAEEFGFVGSAFVVSLYTILIIGVLNIAKSTPRTDQFQFCLAIATMTIIQAGVNIGMNIGIMPITGITLPFLSYGGSSILSLSLMFGVIQSIAGNSSTKTALHLR